MRYGRPSIAAALDGFTRGGVRAPVLPLYPQYALELDGLDPRARVPLVGRGAGTWRRCRVCRRSTTGRRSSTPSPTWGGRCWPRPAGPRAVQLPRAARAPGEEERRDGGATAWRGRTAATRWCRPTATATGRSASPPRGALAQRLGLPAKWTVTLPVAAGADAVDQALHRRGPARAARAAGEAARGVLPGLRRRLPGDAGGDRHPGEGPVPRAGGE